ncbi:hypothetical protein G9A89_003506 [Geosiphon pyriformis]|nr:hypothetical protein G9A89_003506 [Geosiphon pyriformis]
MSPIKATKKNTGPWTGREDQELRRLFSVHKRRWRLISKEMNGTRTHKQIRERWVHHLDLSINQEPLSELEKSIIIEKCGTIGHKWAKIAKCLPSQGRTPLMIRNFWHSEKRQAFHRIRERMSLDILLN